MLSHFFMEEGSFKLANIQRWSCILLSVGFTLHKINFFCVLNMLNCYISGERMIILHAGYIEGSVPNARKNHLFSYIKITSIHAIKLLEKKASPN